MTAASGDSAARDGADVPARESAGRSIACMEVWGGSSGLNTRVCVPGNDVHVRCTPHLGGDHGGDVYYVSNCAAGLITRFALADVSGHGEQVAGVAASLRKLMRKHINTADQSRFARDINSAFSGLELDGLFATAVLATYFAPSKHLIVCNAGHPRPLLYRQGTGEWCVLDTGVPGVRDTTPKGRDEVGIANLPLGVLDPTDYRQFAVKLGEGDMVVMYTGALIEAKAPDGRQLGEAGLLELARGLGESEKHDVPAALMSAACKGGTCDLLDDDATVIAITHTGEKPQQPTVRERISRLAGMLGLGGVDSESGGS